MRVFKFLSFVVFVLSLSLSMGELLAAGMVPDTSVVMVDVMDGEGTINITNTDDKVALLYTAVENVPEDEEDLLVVTPPIARVEAGERQLVRFIIQTEGPILTQRLKRVSFEGIPPKNEDGSARIGVTVRQNLPVIINPEHLPIKRDPWKLLKWSVVGDMLEVMNDSKYVVRLHQQVDLLPGETKLSLSRTYVLPGQSERIKLPASALGSDSFLRIYPASAYGYAVGSYDAPLSR